MIFKDGLCPEAAEFARRGEDWYRRGAEIHVQEQPQVAEQLFKQGRNALDRAARAQAIHLAQERRKPKKDPAAGVPR